METIQSKGGRARWAKVSKKKRSEIMKALSLIAVKARKKKAKKLSTQ